jgi:Uma2 family endonuclease
MKSAPAKTKRLTSNGKHPGPAWDVALLFPEQGEWSVQEYLDLPGNRLIEYTDGHLEFLPMPTTSHQWIVFLFHQMLQQFVWPHLGLALFAPLRIRISKKKFREPDVVFMLNEHKDRIGDEYWTAADLAMEVVSPGKKARQRDLVDKRQEYARAGIREYWIIDPRLREIIVYQLKAKKYFRIGIFKKGTQAVSRLLPGFTVDVDAIFAKP